MIGTVMGPASGLLLTDDFLFISRVQGHARALGFDIETSPTKNRTFTHAPDHGYIVPESTCPYEPGEPAAPSSIHESLTTTAT